MPFVPAEPGLQRADERDEAVVWTVARPGVGESEPGTTQETSSGLWTSSGDTEVAKDKTKNGVRQSRDGKKQGDQEERKRDLGKHLGGARAVPIRNVEAGPFMMEVWVEQNASENSQEVGIGYKNPSVEDE